MDTTEQLKSNIINIINNSNLSIDILKDIYNILNRNNNDQDVSEHNYINTHRTFKQTELDNLVESPYSTTYEEATYWHGKMYDYTTPIPYVGLVGSKVDSGYGSGFVRSYIVTDIYRNKKQEINQVGVAAIYSYNPDKMTLKYINSEYKTILAQSGNMDGDWVVKGDKSSQVQYYITFGDIRPSSNGYYK